MWEVRDNPGLPESGVNLPEEGRYKKGEQKVRQGIPWPGPRARSNECIPSCHDKPSGPKKMAESVCDLLLQPLASALDAGDMILHRFCRDRIKTQGLQLSANAVQRSRGLLKKDTKHRVEGSLEVNKKDSVRLPAHTHLVLERSEGNGHKGRGHTPCDSGMCR